MSCACDEHVVFDANASPSGQVDPWFDGDNHPRLQLDLRVLGHPRAFVNLQPNSVSQPMTKVFAPTGLADCLPGDRIDLSTRDSGADSFDSPLVGLQHNPI